MKLSNMISLITMALAVPFSAQAGSMTRYQLTITNGSGMPISPAAIYVKTGQSADVIVGQSPTAGFIKLCQMGDPSVRIPELNVDPAVSFVTQTSAPILPGSSRMVEVDVQNPAQQSIHFEMMYGKTKDTCGVGSVTSAALNSLMANSASEYDGKDDVLRTGAFMDAALPSGPANPNLCSDAADSVSCLRELALPTTGTAQIHFFSAYLPSLINLLEAKYGSMDASTLIIPSSGAIQFKLTLLQ